MAILNGENVDFSGLTFKRIGAVIFEASPRDDGKGITLELFLDEEEAFLRFGGLFIGQTICTLLSDAVRKAGGDPKDLSYRYRNRVFTT